MNNKKRHAYLILAHSEFEGLIYLVRALDHPQNDIYIHIDKKSKGYNTNLIKAACNKSRVYFVTRVKVYWADSSMIQAEYSLFKEAAKNNYHYYHLISESHFPLKTQAYIHEYFENDDRIMIDFHEENEEDPFLYKIKYYYPFRKYYRNIISGRGRFPLILKVVKNVYYKTIEIQKHYNFSRIAEGGEEYFKGNQWVSLPHDFVEYLIANEKTVLKEYHHTDCSDEIFIPTLLMNSDFRNRINLKSNTLVDWERGRPYSFFESDFEELASADYLFARKISYRSNPKLVEKLFKMVRLECDSK